jgi:hypothetical protein
MDVMDMKKEEKGIGMQDVISGICVEREETGSGGRAGRGR